MDENFLLNLVPQRNDAVLAYRIFEGQAVVVDLVHGTLNALNTTATRIWQLMEGGVPVGGNRQEHYSRVRSFSP